MTAFGRISRQHFCFYYFRKEVHSSQFASALLSVLMLMKCPACCESGDVLPALTQRPNGMAGCFTVKGFVMCFEDYSSDVQRETVWLSVTSSQLLISDRTTHRKLQQEDQTKLTKRSGLWAYVWSLYPCYIFNMSINVKQSTQNKNLLLHLSL